jgi:hypothetical protein
MLNEHIPLNNSKQNSHAMATDYNADMPEREWERLHLEQSKVGLPWHSPVFWVGVTSTVWFAGMVLWVIWGAATSVVKSEWVEKPARASEVVELKASVKRVEDAATKTDAKLDRITTSIETLTQSAVIAAESARQASTAAAKTDKKVDDLIMSAFARTSQPPQK